MARVQRIRRSLDSPKDKVSAHISQVNPAKWGKLLS